MSGTASRSIGCSNCNACSGLVTMMPDTDLSVSRVVVFVSALVYWAGVFIQARRIRRRIGRSPNVKPRGTKEKLLWAGWFLWSSPGSPCRSWRELALPQPVSGSCLFFCGRVGFSLGIVLTVAGYAGTLWCYAAMGNTWRMGVDQGEKTIAGAAWTLSVREASHLFLPGFHAGRNGTAPSHAHLPPDPGCPHRLHPGQGGG